MIEKKNKKSTKILCLLLILCIVIMPITGCSTQEIAKPEEKPEEKPEVKPTAIVIGTGGVTGTYYPIGGAIANVITANTNATVTAESTGGSVANIRMVNNKEIMLGMTGATSLYQIFNGIPPYENETAKDVRAICALFPETYQVVVRQDSGLETIDQLKGKKVGVGSAGSGTEAIGKQILEAHGVTYDDIKPEYLSFADSVTALKDKHIDAGVVFAGVPTSAVIELCSTEDVNILGLSPNLMNDKEKFDKFMKDNPFFTLVKIKAGTYSTLKNDVDTLATPCILITQDDADEELIYNITKAIFENLPDIHKAHSLATTISLETALEGTSIPLHPGAEKYFKEAGILK